MDGEIGGTTQRQRQSYYSRVGRGHPSRRQGTQRGPPHPAIHARFEYFIQRRRSARNQGHAQQGVEQAQRLRRNPQAVRAKEVAAPRRKNDQSRNARLGKLGVIAQPRDKYLQHGPHTRPFAPAALIRRFNSTRDRPNKLPTSHWISESQKTALVPRHRFNVKSKT